MLSNSVTLCHLLQFQLPADVISRNTEVGSVGATVLEGT